MQNKKLYQWHRLFDRWQGHHRWQDYDSMSAVYPTFEEFKAWFDSVEFRLYTIQNLDIMVNWGVAQHRSLKHDVTRYDLTHRSPLWFNLYDKTKEDDQWTLDGTIKVMISLMKYGALARCNLRMNGRHSINKGAKLAWASWLLNEPCPLVVAHPSLDIPQELAHSPYQTVQTIQELEGVYPEPSRAVLLPRTYGKGPHNIDAWTLHEGWSTYKDFKHTQFPSMNWDLFFNTLWTWARPYDPEPISVWHNESNQMRLFPLFDVDFPEWKAFWTRCSRLDLISVH